MKKLLIIPAIVGLLTTSVFAKAINKDDENRISYSVVNQFKSDFRDAKDVTWTITDNTQKAEFTTNGVRKTAFYNMSGEFMGTTQRVAYTSVSESAKKTISTKYKGYTVGDVIQLSTNDTVQLFVDLHNAKEEILVRVSPTSSVSFFQQVK